MKTYAGKTRDDRNQSGSIELVRKRHGNRPAQFADNRPEVVAQRRLQEIATNSPRARQSVQSDMALRNTAQVTHVEAPHDSTPIQRKHTGVTQLLPRWARMALGASAGLIVGALTGGTALALGAVGAAGAAGVAGLAGLAGAAVGARWGNRRRRHGTAEERLARMHDRGVARSDRGRIDTGRYDTPTGPTTLSGLFGQRMTQSRQSDYGGESFGRLPPYAGLQGNIPDAALPLLANRNAPAPALSDRQRLATALTHTLAHGSEEDRAPGTSSYFRAMTRDYRRHQGDGQHPLSVANFPARSTAQEQRDLMEGRTALSEQQRRALEDDSGESSDEEDPHYIERGAH